MSGPKNRVWRDLFVRLAPEEPFVPAFAVPETNGGPVEAVLETWYRSRGKGGDPRAMLSAGNLNTAALTLFLALHLSVSPDLPWLVIDDPVQSMDEVHIAQFTALLRMLANQTCSVRSLSRCTKSRCSIISRWSPARRSRTTG